MHRCPFLESRTSIFFGLGRAWKEWMSEIRLRAADRDASTMGWQEGPRGPRFQSCLYS